MRKNKEAMFGAGCFWGVQQAFDLVKGVISTKVGYSGGITKNPSYRQVCSGETGHAEVVYVKFDEKKVNYDKLLEVFWQIHDPTQKNRQGPDVGDQYRSAIFYYDDKQKKSAEKSLKEQEKKIGKKIATIIEKAKEFYPAEDYHQKYYVKELDRKSHTKVCGSSLSLLKTKIHLFSDMKNPFYSCPVNLKGLI